MRHISKFFKSAWMIFPVLMTTIAHYRFLHLYGQRGARLDSDQSIHVATLTPRPLFIKIFVALLFWAPDIHLRSLRKIWVDRVLHHRPWFEFTKQLHTDYQEFSLMVLVIQYVPDCDGLIVHYRPLFFSAQTCLFWPFRASTTVAIEL